MKMIQRIEVIEKEDEDGKAVLDIKMHKCLDHILDLQAYQEAASKQEFIERILREALETELKSQKKC